jgi:hypothetical protein
LGLAIGPLMLLYLRNKDITEDYLKTKMKKKIIKFLQNSQVSRLILKKEVIGKWVYPDLVV